MHGAYPTCDLCQTDEYLVYERVRAVRNPADGVPTLWDVDCWCGKCETFYGFRTIRPPKDPQVVLARMSPPGGTKPIHRL
ncbi:hypothetical protein GCM10009628_18110 [Paeniglutamicibacter kerguelensis]